MAAGAYKGLTIRIGADTTSLSSALRGANSAIYKTQTELRKLNKAAKLDPGNNDVQKAQLGAMASQAMDAASKMTTLNKSINEMSSQTAKSNSNKTIGELAEATDNAALSAEEAKKRYNDLTDELGHVYNGVEKVTKLDLGDFTRQSPEDFEKGVEALRAWANDTNRTEAELQKFAKKNGGSVDEVIEKIRQLKDSWNDASDSFSDASMVQSLHNARTEATVMDATVKGLAKSMADLDSGSTLSKTDNIGNIDGKLKLISAAADAAGDKFRRLDEASKMNPTSISTMVERSKALAEATEVARAKSMALGEKIAAYKSEGVDRMAKAIGNIPVELERSKQAWVDSTSEVSRLEGELRNAQVALQNLKDHNVDKLSQEFKNAESEVERLNTELDKAKKDQSEAFDRFNTTKMCSELDEAETEVRELNAAIKDMGRIDLGGVSTAAVQAAQQLGQLAGQAGQKIVESSADVDSAYRDLRKTFDAEEADYQRLYDAAMQYSQSHVTSADKMLEMEAIAAQVGVGIEGGADAIQHFAEVASNLDVATDINADEIALKMGQITNVMEDLREDNVERFGDALVRLGNTMPAQESAIMQITQRLSAVGSVANFTTPELLGWAAAIAGTGQRSEAAATGISNTITAIQKAVGTGGDALDTFAETAGMSAEKFAEKWQEAPTEALKLFLEGLDDLDEAALQRLEDLDITGVRQTQTLLALAQTTDTVTDAINSANEAWGDEAKGIASSGDAAKEAEKKAQGFSGVLEKLKNSVQVLAASFGEALVPWMERATVWIQNFGKWLDSMGSGFKSTTVLVGGALVAFSTIEPIVAALAGNLMTLASGAIKAVVQGFTMLPAVVKGTGVILRSFVANPVAVSSALSGAGGAAGLFGKALGLLANPMSLVTGGIGLLVGAIAVDYIGSTVKAKIESDKFNAALQGMSETTEGLGAAMQSGSKDTEKYGKSWRDAKVDMDEFISSMEEHNRKNAETRDSAATSIGQLEKYKDIIDKAAGAGDDYKGSQLELKTAIDGVNEMLGTSYTKNDVLKGVYQDEAGVVRDLRAELDKLIDTKKQEIRVSATEDIYKEAVTAQAEAEQAYNKARKARREYVNEYKKEHTDDLTRDKWTGEMRGMTDEELTNAARGTTQYKELAQAVDETKQALRESNEAVKESEAVWETAVSNSGPRDSIILSNDRMREAAESIGLTGTALSEFTNKLADSKVGVEEFSGMTGKKFASLVKESGGDIDKLVDLVSEWNMQKLEKKYGEFDFDEQAFVDAEGYRTEWNGEEWAPAKIEVDTSDPREELMLLNDDMREVLLSTMDWGETAQEAQPKIQELAQKLEEAHVGMGRFTDLAENHPDVFADMVTQASGDMDTLVGLIDEWNRQQLNDINFGITWDGDDAFTTAEGVRYEWNNGEWRQVELDVDSSKVPEQAEEAKAQIESTDATQPIDADTSDAEGKVSKLKSDLEADPIKLRVDADTSAAESMDVQGKSVTLTSKADTKGATEMAKAIAKVPKNTPVKVTAKTEGKKDVDNLHSAIKKTAKNWTTTLKASVSGESGVNSLLRTLRDANGRTYSVTFDTYRVTHYRTDGKPNAKGGYVPGMLNIPRHADGFIATRPTLTQYGWIGEDGAEAYSGGSLVPLTNRKYSQPYIDDISDAVAKKLGPTGSGPQVNITITGVEGADDVAQAIARQFALLDL